MRNKILDILYREKGQAVSGQAISRVLGVSRTAVWKHIKTLTEEGYQIKGRGGSGYRLEDCDVLNGYELKRSLGPDIPFIFENKVDSTNSFAKRIANQCDNEFTLVTADLQDNGRGRMGRSFESNNKMGVWCSFILKPSLSPENSLIITIASALAVCKTIEDISGQRTGIKWPNDIVIKGKKICGILSEMSCETGAVEYIVVGIGINVFQRPEDFSQGVSKIATSMLIETGRRYRRGEIIASLCYNMQEIYALVTSGATDKIEKRWKKYSVTDGKQIKIIKNNRQIIAYAKGIDSSGRLITTDTNGEVAVYNSGEISLRGIMEYS